ISLASGKTGSANPESAGSPARRPLASRRRSLSRATAERVRVVRVDGSTASAADDATCVSPGALCWHQLSRRWSVRRRPTSSDVRSGGSARRPVVAPLRPRAAPAPALVRVARVRRRLRIVVVVPAEARAVVAAAVALLLPAAVGIVPAGGSWRGRNGRAVRRFGRFRAGVAAGKRPGRENAGGELQREALVARQPRRAPAFSHLRPPLPWRERGGAVEGRRGRRRGLPAPPPIPRP